MTITIDLPSEVADRLSRRAAEDGKNVAGYVQQLAVRDASLWDAPTLSAWDTLLDSFAEGEVEDHCETVETLARALHEDRPGQRQLFDKGESAEQIKL